MIAGTIIGAAINPGKTDLDQPVTLELTRYGDNIVLQEISVTNSGDEQPLVLMREEFASAAALQKSYPKLAEKLANQDRIEVPVSNGMVRVQHEMRGITIIWQRQHDGVPAVTQIHGKSVYALQPFWKSVA